jgi:dTDP-4-amino-4,6-dideoxygalactose transaminase
MQRIGNRYRMHVPLLDLPLQYKPLREQILAEIAEVCDSQQLVLGKKTEDFEKAVCTATGARHCIGVSSGTDAQLILLMALGIQPGDTVITTPYTFFATAGCIARIGARPVFVDIQPDTFNIDPAQLEYALKQNPNTKAVCPVHLFGCCADMEAITRICAAHGVPVLEDAAQALGAAHPLGAAGTIGEAGWYSFYPTKNLGAFGDAGMVTCQDDALAAKMRRLRNHGMEPRYFHSDIGGNFRIDAIQSAVLNIKLPHLDFWSAERRAKARWYREAFANTPELAALPLPAEPWLNSGLSNHHIYNQFIIRVPHRDKVRALLAKNGVGSEIYYPLPLHLQECFRYLGYKEGDFPNAESAANESLAIPIFPELTHDQQSHVVTTLAAALREVTA